MSLDKDSLKKDLVDAFMHGLEGNPEDPTTAAQVAQFVAFAIVAYAAGAEHKITPGAVFIATPTGPVPSSANGQNVTNTMAQGPGMATLLGQAQASFAAKDKFALLAAAIPVYIATFMTFAGPSGSVAGGCVPGPKPDFGPLIDLGMNHMPSNKDKPDPKEPIEKMAAKMADIIHNTFKASTFGGAVTATDTGVGASAPSPLL